jgi:hypothetical protein
MEAFATVEDLQARWRVLTDEEKTKAETLLGDASVHLQTLINRKFDADFEPDELYKENLKIVCCNIVMRSMNVRGGFFGMEQVSTTAGSYSQSFTPINSSGDMRLTSEELKLLGLKGSNVGFVFPFGRKEFPKDETTEDNTEVAS